MTRVAASALILVGVAATTAEPCTCIGPTLQGAFATSAVVCVVKVLSVEHTPAVTVERRLVRLPRVLARVDAWMSRGDIPSRWDS